MTEEVLVGGVVVVVVALGVVVLGLSVVLTSISVGAIVEFAVGKVEGASEVGFRVGGTVVGACDGMVVLVSINVVGDMVVVSLVGATVVGGIVALASNGLVVVVLVVSDNSSPQMTSGIGSV